MKKELFLFLLLGFSIFSYSQERKIKISVQHGYFNGGNYFNNVIGGTNTGMDISYFLSERFFLTAHFNHGENGYYENSWVTNYPDPLEVRYADGTNATLIINNVGLLAGYCFPVTQWANVTGQLGFSQFIKVAKAFPLKLYDPDPDPYPYDYILANRDFAFFSASFPVKFSVGVTPFRKLNIGVAKNIEIGYAVGFYMAPDFGFFTGVYHGPQLSVSF